VWARFSETVQTGPGLKQPGRVFGYPLHLGPRLNKEWSYTPASSLYLHGLFYGEMLPLPFTVIYLWENVVEEANISSMTTSYHATS
jgi:hypothetical protein